MSTEGENFRDLWEQGRRVWPQLDLTLQGFCAYMAAHLTQRTEGSSRAARPTNLHAGDLYLAGACLARVPGAAQCFEEAVIRPLHRSLSSWDPETIGEVQQLLRVRLLLGEGGTPRLLRYDGTVPLLAYVRVAAIHSAVSEDRRRGRERPLTERDEQAGPQAAATGALHGALAQALREVLDRLPDEESNLLYLYYFEGLEQAELARKFKVDRSTISRWLERIRQQIYEATKLRLREHAKVDSSMFTSLTQNLYRDLDISLRQLLRPDGGGEKG